MPSTPTFALPYPALTDPPNVPADMQDLAEATETALDSRSVRVVSSTSDIAAPYTGMIVFSTADLLLYRWTGSAWVKLDSGIPACTAQLTGTQSIANTTDSDIAWSSAEENWTDPISGLAMFDGANPTRITIRKDGVYDVGFSLKYAQNASTGGKRVATLTRNNTGVPTNASALAYDSSRFNTNGDVSQLGDSCGGIRLAAGDVLRLSTWQNSTVAQNVIGNTLEGKSRMWAVWRKP